MTIVVALQFLVLGVATLAPLGVFHIPSFGKVPLRRNSEDEFLTTLTTDQDLRLESVLHISPSSLIPNLIHEVQDKRKL